MSIALSVWSQPCRLRLSGHVEDADTKEKLAAATVMLKENELTITTDERGDFSFQQLCEGNYTLLISHTNCLPVEKKVRLVRNLHLDIFLPHAVNVLGEVVVAEKKGLPNTGFNKSVSGRELAETRGSSLAEALSKINGVSLLQTGSTISKPVIHGLHSNRILTINNGVRQEGQQWGNEHAPEIDPFIAGRLSVIKGVDELKYGSDAIGGVILVDPRPMLDQPGYSTEINTAYFSNNRQYVVSGVFEQQLKRMPAFTYRIQGTYKKAANVNTPDYRLNNTASQEANFSATAGWKKQHFSSEVFFSHFSTKLGIFTGSHIGNLTDLLAAIEAPKPDDVFLGQDSYTIQRPYQQVSHNLLKSKSVFRKNGHVFHLLLAAQLNARKEYDIVRNSSNKNPQLDLSISTFSEDLSWDHPVKGNFSGTAGIAAMQQDNSYRGRYFIPNYLSYSFGGYYIEKWSRHKWELQAGIRYDNKTISTNRLRFSGDTISYDFNFSTAAGSFNAIFKPTDSWKLNANIGLANRAPYVNELLSDGIHHGTATYEKGDIGLKPEKSLNTAIGINYVHPSGHLQADVQFYSNRISDFIYQQPRPDEPVLTIAGAFPLLEYKQTDAVLNGFDLAASWSFLSRLEWTGKFSGLYARNRRMDDWLIMMPANRLNNELTLTFNDAVLFRDRYCSVELTNVFTQSRVPDDKNGKQDYKAPPPGYTLLNLNASGTMLIHQIPLTIALAVRNALNTRYRDYLNSMRYFTDEMGRNISLRLTITLNHKTK